MRDTVVVSVRLNRQDYEMYAQLAEERRISLGALLRNLAQEGLSSGRSVRELVACLENDAHLRRTLRRLLLNPAED